MPQFKNKLLLKKPRMQTQRQQRAEQTRQKLMEVAIAMFARHGFDNVSVEHITQKAGVSKGTFYCHFKSKHSVVLERMRELDMANHEFFRQAMHESNPVDQLLTYMRNLTNYNMHVLGIGFTRIVYISHLSNEGFVRLFTEKDRPIYGFLEKIIQEGQRTGVFRRDLPAMEMAHVLIHVLRGSTYEWCMYDGSYSLTDKSQAEFKRALDILLAQRPVADDLPAGTV